MRYNYNNMKPHMDENDFQKVKNNVLNSKKDVLTLDDFAEGFAAFDSWLMLAYIDKLIELGFIRIKKKEGFYNASFKRRQGYTFSINERKNQDTSRR